MNSTAALAEIQASLATEPPANLCPLSFPHPAHDACDGKPQAPAFGRCHSTLEGDGTAPTKPVTVTDAPAVTGSLPFDRAGIVDLLQAMRAASPRTATFKDGYRTAIAVLCSHIEQQLTASQLWEAGEEPADLTPTSSLGAHLAATRRHFQILA